MTKMSNYPHGTFSWIDLATSDPDAGKKFYSELVGWEYVDNDAGGMIYSMCMRNGEPVAGLSGMMPEMEAQGIPPHWTSYVTVTSADEITAKCKELGGTALMEPMDVLDVGRMAMLQDPTGAAFAIWEPKVHIGAHVVNEPGSLCWNELYTNDKATAEKFYTELFGWKSMTNDVGGGMMYTSVFVGDRPNGGMMEIQKEWGEVPAHWGMYLAVESCDETVEKAKSLGGQLVNGPMEVPEVGKMALLQDPQGAHFNVIQLVNPQ